MKLIRLEMTAVGMTCSKLETRLMISISMIRDGECARGSSESRFGG